MKDYCLIKSDMIKEIKDMIFVLRRQQKDLGVYIEQLEYLVEKSFPEEVNKRWIENIKKGEM